MQGGLYSFWLNILYWYVVSAIFVRGAHPYSIVAMGNCWEKIKIAIFQLKWRKKKLNYDKKNHFRTFKKSTYFLRKIRWKIFTVFNSNENRCSGTAFYFTCSGRSFQVHWATHFIVLSLLYTIVMIEIYFSFFLRKKNWQKNNVLNGKQLSNKK